MDLLFIIFLFNLVAFLNPRAAEFYSAAKGWVGIAAPSSSTDDVPSHVPASNVLPSTVPIMEDSCPVSDFTSTLWFCLAPTAIPSATATATTTATSTRVSSTGDNSEPVTFGALAPGLPVAYLLCIAGLVAFFTVLNICINYNSRQAKGAQRPVDLPEESLLSCWDSVLNGTYYDLFIDQGTLCNFAIYQWQESEDLRSQITADKLGSDARESDLKNQISARERAHKTEIDAIESANSQQVRRLHNEITARELAHGEKIEKLNSANDINTINTARDARERHLLDETRAKERAHNEDIAARERSYKKQIADIKAKSSKKIADVKVYARNHRRKLYIEVEKRKEAENRWDALVKAGMLASVVSKPKAETSPQGVAPASITDQLLLALAEMESSTREAEEASPTEAASRATTPEQDSAEPTAETSPQDVAPGTEIQIPSPPAAIQALTRQTEGALSAEPASPASIPTPNLDSTEPTAETSPQDVALGLESQITSPPAANSSLITKAEEKLPAQTEGLPEAESTTPPRSGTEQEHEPDETEDLSEVESTSPPKSGTEQVHEQVQEEGEMEEEPRNSGTPLTEPFSMGEGVAQIPQDQEKGLAQDAPVPTEEQAASLQLTEPEAAPGPATSDDGASEAPVAMEVEPEDSTGDRETKEPGAVQESAEAHAITASERLEMRTTEGDQIPPAQTVPEEPADGMDEEDSSPSVEATLKYFGASANDSESLTSPPASRAGVINLDDKMEDALPDEAPADPRMDVDTTDDAANDSENKSLARPSEESSDSRMEDDGIDDATNAPGSQPMDVGEIEMAEAPRQDSGDNQGLPSQINNTPATETVRPLSSNNTPLLQLLYPHGLSVQPVSNGSGASSGPVRWNFSRAPTFQRGSQIPQPAQQPSSTQQAPSAQQPTPRPETKTSPPLASAAKDWPLENAKTLNTWAVHVNSVSRQWINSPEFAGLDGNTFQQARNDPNSQFSKTILQAENWARYLTTDVKHELKKSPLSTGAQTVFRHAVPAVRKMREQYGVLSQSKGCPHLFVALLRDIDCMLKELSVLVPESPTPPAQRPPPAQSTQQVPSQSTPQTARTGQQSGNYLYSYETPLLAAMEIKKCVQEIEQTYHLWEPNTRKDRSGKITSRGTDKDDFIHWDKDFTSRFWAIKRQTRWIAEWLENRGERFLQAEVMLREQVKPLMKNLRDKINHLAAIKGCGQLFETWMRDIIRIVKELEKIN
ncbi:hypothetical protein MBLNU13_g03039t1 [Cladosporium sp. NU13]